MLKTMPPVEGARGYARLPRPQLRAGAESGAVRADPGGGGDGSGAGSYVEAPGATMDPALGP